MASNLKPWERARLGNGNVASSLPPQASSFPPPSSSLPSVASAPTQQSQAQTQSQTQMQPSSLAPSASSLGYNRYGSGLGYGSSLSSGYGLGYGSSGFSSYGMSPYSSSFGYGASSFMTPGVGIGGVDIQGGLIGNGIALLNQVMEGFSRFSYLFGASFDAFRNAVMSLLGMYKGISPLLGFAKSLTIFKLLRALLNKLYSLLMWVCGVDAGNKNSAWGTEFASSETSKAPLAIRAGVGALFAIATPSIIMKIFEFFKRLFYGKSINDNGGKVSQQQQQKQEQEQEKGSITIGTEYVASHDFNGENETELSFKKGDKIIVLDPNACPGQELWANAEMNGKKGKVPMNFLAPTSESVGLPEPSSSFSQMTSSSSSMPPSYSGLSSLSSPYLK